uniref:Uncharacterized protein n=1 Tax=Aureoumbra lagunensis TaxID=44058 RepID=A0A7S3JTW1_9STRA|mmetsp:Transcript_2341/g.3745  ORF Transcript_2341/g.3745 Transcript_2341/m.3745 type:complete len:473 (+) Transcript_2341:78-1496(+)
MIGYYPPSGMIEEALPQSTQPATQLDDESSDCNNLTGEAEIVWGRIFPMSQGGLVHDLKSLPGQQFGNKIDVYTIGRNSRCDIVLNDARISGFHCRIYRQLGRNDLDLDCFLPFIEDISTNGTFVNNVRLIKHEPRQLISGDEIALVSPKKDAQKQAVYTYNSNALHAQNTFVSSRGDGFFLQNNACSPLALNVADDITRNKKQKIHHFKPDVRADYELREILGSGAIGKVYRGIDLISGHAWAIKMISLEKSNIPQDSSTHWLREAIILKSLRHKAIVSIRDVYCNTKQLAIVMELVEGGDLFDRLVKRHRYPENDAKQLLQNLLPALAYLHDQGIAHRDCKPENILLRTKYSHVDVLLTDFGLAKFAAVGSTACTTVCGTPQYIAPEVIQETKGENLYYNGAAADIWSVGVVLYLLLSGTQPTRTDWMFDSIFYSISSHAKNVITHMTIINPSFRPSANDILQLPWFSSP